MGAKFKSFISLLDGYRKFTIMLLVIITGIIFRVTNLVNGAEFVNLLQGTVIAFMAFNGIEHTTKAIQAWVKAKF